MIVPAPPKKYLQVEDLVVGQKYWIDSGLGGVHTVIYEGYSNAWHNFKNTNPEWFDYSLSPERVPTSIHVCYDKIESLEEWRALGGKFPNE